MRAVIFERPGDEDVLAIGPAPDPRPGAGEILIEVDATSVNRADLYQRQGKYPPPAGASEILGLECAGRVLETGEGVVGFHAGDRVMALLAGGGYAERAAVDAGSVMPVPTDMTMIEAGAFPEVYLTAFLNVFRLGAARAGERLLVHGGGSGIGTAALALGREAGIPVFVTVGSGDKARRCREFGAAAAIDYRDPEWSSRLREAAGGGFDLILDPIGARYLPQHLDLLETGGRLLVIGGQGGIRSAELDVARLVARRLSLIGSTLRARPAAEKADIVRHFLERFGPALTAGRLRPVIDSVFPLDEVADAHRRVAAGHHFGKVAIQVR